MKFLEVVYKILLILVLALGFASIVTAILGSVALTVALLLSSLALFLGAVMVEGWHSL